MSQITKFKDSEFFVELSDKEQETVAGGAGLADLFGSIFIQHTDIDTSAEAITTLDGGNASAIRRTGYKMSQTTISIPILALFGGGGRRSRHARTNIFNLLRSLFS
jgi:hypothetical protein